MASEVTSEANASAAAGGTGKDPHQHSILTAKVSRALEVRTDTPAMKAALDALAHLPDHQDEMFTVDSRSVRVAIEQDALQQALLLQRELRTLLDTVVQLRQGVTETAAIAHRVSDAIHINVMSNPTPSSMRGVGVAASMGMQPTSTSEAGEDDAEASTSPRSTPLVMTELVETKNTNDALGQEQKLAALLSDSFLQRNLARKRLDAVHAFLEKFDLSDEDSRLLDHYAFDDVEASSSQVNGMAFLIALERVRVIRKELARTFGRIDLMHHHRLAQQDTNARDNRLGASSALRMMETLAQKQERAYERLYHWLQKFLQLHSYGTSGNSAPAMDEDHLDEALSNPFVRRSLYALRNVPAFYSHLLELIAASRRSEETRRFLLALTSGYGGLPPIEMRAHDAVVYVGDMLAFCFRAFSIEADVAKGLFNYKLEEDAPDGGEEIDDSLRTPGYSFS
jgi:conserved oligomeric Golgi complex subunit 6